MRKAKRYGLNAVGKEELAALFRRHFNDGRFDRQPTYLGRISSFWHVTDGPYTAQEIVDSMSKKDALGNCDAAHPHKYTTVIKTKMGYVTVDREDVGEGSSPVNLKPVSRPLARKIRKVAND